MFEIYSTKYRDNFGEETTTIQNNGKSLHMRLRGIEFQCSMLDDWKPKTKTAPSSLFALWHGQLCSYRLDCKMQVPVVDSGKISSGILRVELELGAPNEDGGIDREYLQLELTLNGKSYKSSGKHSWFEDGLLEIHAALPKKTYIRSCFNCAFSDYSPAGFGLFGCMACFRNCKQAYLSLKGKEAYFQLQDRIAEYVQETYLCPEFKKRVPDTGYRG
jgi:Family of unknown function (DUF6304)